jgi:hypothetical protein
VFDITVKLSVLVLAWEPPAGSGDLFCPSVVHAVMPVPIDGCKLATDCSLSTTLRSASQVIIQYTVVECNQILRQNLIVCKVDVVHNRRGHV